MSGLTGILAKGLGLAAQKEWRLTWREHDVQGGWWPMGPEIFTDYGEAYRAYRRLRAKVGDCYDGAVKDIEFKETIVVTTQELPS